MHDRTREDLAFQPSPSITLGVELELQVLDHASGELVPGALRILDACAEEGIAGVSGEFLLSMLEVKTGVCRDVAEVRDTLFPTLRRARNVARSLGYDLALGGTHPSSRPSGAAIFPAERYQRIGQQQGWLAYHESIFGMHVHVGVPGAEEAVGLVNLLVPYLPHLLALSASSPFWEGIDTGLASARSRLFRPAAHAGVPPHFRCWDEVCHHVGVLRQAGTVHSTKDLYWDIRPRPQLGTIEVRVFDTPASLSFVLGLAALTRCLVLDGLRLLRERPELVAGDPRAFWLAQESKWLASRYGLHAKCARRPGRARRTLLDDTAGLLDRLLPVAEQAGEAGFLAAFLPVERLETGADRQRRLCRQSGDWHAVIDDMKSRWAEELEALAEGSSAGGPEGTASEARLGG
jgi:carboxylate-amine ligase